MVRQFSILVIFLLATITSLIAQRVPQKTVYSIRTSDFDPKRNLTIDIEDSNPFGVSIITDSAIKKATVFYNEQNARDITPDISTTQFTIEEFNSITLKVELAKKEFAKARAIKMAEVSYTDSMGRPAKDTVSLNRINDFITTNKISKYAVETINIQPAENELNLGASSDYTIVFINRTDSLRNSNLLIGALIKSLAGARPQDELLDIFLKLNYGKQKRFFSLIGADAGIGSNRDSSETGLFRINEAVANFNYAFYGGKTYKPIKLRNAKGNIARADTLALNDSLKIANVKRFDALKRTAFVGGGLKIFNSTPYVGLHFGSIEINGALFGSYIMAGYYYSPYLQVVTSKDSLQFQNYRNNIYLEAGINAFGSKVPSILRTLKLKFGLMLPVKGSKKDDIKPGAKDVISRLAIEVPLGTVFRF
jgi:hypothetical protein